MMQVANDRNIPDEVWVGHHARQELIVVVGLQRLLLQQFSLLGLDRGNDGHLQHAYNTSFKCCQSHVQRSVDQGLTAWLQLQSHVASDHNCSAFCI